MLLSELIDLIDVNFTDTEQQKVLNILYHEKGAIEPSEELKKLVSLGILEEAGSVRLAYKIEKYFNKHSIESISQKKEFLFKFISDTKGLKGGKRASYDDLLNFATLYFSDVLYDAVKEIQTFVYTPEIVNIGPQIVQYLSRKITISKNYEFDELKNVYYLKNDEYTKLLITHGVKLEPTLEKGSFKNVITLDFSDVTNKYIQKKQKLGLLKIFLLIIFWPVGLYVLFKNLNQRKDDARE